MRATVPAPQGRRDRAGQHQPAHRVEPGHADARRPVGMAVQAGETGIALEQRAVGDGARLRSGAAETRGRDVDEVRIDGADRLRAEAEPVHDAGRVVLDQHVRLRGERAGDRDRLGLLQVEHDAALRLPEHPVQAGAAAGVATARRLDLHDLGAHRGEVARRRRAGDHPAEVEHADTGERQARRCGGRRGIARGERQAEGRAGHCHRPAIEIGTAPIAPVRQLRRVELLGRLAQRQAWHVGRLHCFGWPRLQADIRACRASKLAMRSGLVAKRGSAPQAGSPITFSQDVH